MSEWLRRDVPHVLVRVGDRSVRVGPVVVPGVTACARCLHLHDGDRDRAWPAIAGQLAARPVVAPPLLVLREAAVRTVRRVLETRTSLDGGDGAGDDDGERRVGLMCFREFVNGRLNELSARGLQFFDLEETVGAFTTPLPRVRIIPIEEFDPLRYI